MQKNYDPTDWYWIVAGSADVVWSSKRRAYVPITDEEYVEWSSDTQPTRIDSGANLASIMLERVVPAILAEGIQIESTANPSINATYSLDKTTLDEISAVARDSASGLGLPMNAPAFQYPDLESEMHTFQAADIENLYKAMRDYVAGVTMALTMRARGGQADFPTQPVTIP